MLTRERQHAVVAGHERIPLPSGDPVRVVVLVEPEPPRGEAHRGARSATRLPRAIPHGSVVRPLDIAARVDLRHGSPPQRIPPVRSTRGEGLSISSYALDFSLAWPHPHGDVARMSTSTRKIGGLSELSFDVAKLATSTQRGSIFPVLSESAWKANVSESPDAFGQRRIDGEDRYRHACARTSRRPARTRCRNRTPPSL